VRILLCCLISQPFARAVFTVSAWLLTYASVHLALLAQVVPGVLQDTQAQTVINVGFSILFRISSSPSFLLERLRPWLLLGSQYMHL
jgi:hypothetical protein